MFAEKLKEAVSNVKGGQAVILMGSDGIPVDSYEITPQDDIEETGMEFSVLLIEVKKAIGMLEAGETEELIINTEKISAVVRSLNDEYFIAFMLKRDEANIGKARYRLRVLAPELLKELT